MSQPLTQPLAATVSDLRRLKHFFFPSFLVPTPLSPLPGFQVDTEEARLLLPGMLEALLGIAREESREFDLTFPASWHQESLRNTPARFNVRAVTSEEMPHHGGQWPLDARNAVC